MAPKPGLLYVTMQPMPSLSSQEFHDWYNNEHGPTRLRLPFIPSGFRYRATDLTDSNQGGTAERPEWLAWYDITDMAELTRETYTRLRLPGAKSQRETDTMGQIHVNRKLFDFVAGWRSPSFKDLEIPTTPANTTNVLVSVTFTLKPGADKVAELDKWYNEEHVDMLSKVPGWLRTRRYATSTITPTEEKKETEYMALHEYSSPSGLSSPEFRAAISTPWAAKIKNDIEASRARSVYSLSYIFGPAPRHLAIFQSWTSPDSPTTTIPASPSTHNISAIESYITTPDGVTIPYRLESHSSAPPNGPVILLSNSILTTYHIWDTFAPLFLSNSDFRQYRLLRYNARGRHTLPASAASTPVTLDVLAADIISLLDALRVPRAAALIGVSLGGATVLHAALQYPHRAASFVACDTNAVAPPANRTVWPERVAVTEEEGARDEGSGEEIVGERLAEATVRRWFAVKGDADGSESGRGGGSWTAGARDEDRGRMEEVKEMVRTNSLEGFRSVVRSLFEYDLQAGMEGAVTEGHGGVRGCFVVGSEDGVLPEVMRRMAQSYGINGGKGGRKGGAFEVVEGAGHLPMVQRPREFVEAVGRFISP
ncbi:MAG: hypothetical protein LQ340_001321 [Diploschistes diacapsis]|nr:MAG: hypothetical protein LQ340_001321 [Diploschistes diacapsis]